MESTTEPVELSSSSAAEVVLRAALERIAELEEQLRLAQRQATQLGRACDEWRRCADGTGRALAYWRREGKTAAA